MGFYNYCFQNSERVFVAVRFSEYLKKAFDNHAVLFRGEYSFLPPTSPIRQETDFLFWLKIHRLSEDLADELRGKRKSSGIMNFDHHGVNNDNVPL